MKNIIILTIFSLAIIQSTKGQITINESDFPAPGDTFLTVTDTFGSSEQVYINDFQENDLWNFSSPEADGFDTTRFIDPSETNYASSFPQSNLAEKNNPDNIAYLISTQDYFEVTGYHSSDLQSVQRGPVNINLDNNLTLAEFPSNYQDSFSDTAEKQNITLPYNEIEGFDSVRFDLSIYTTSLIDTFGPLASLTDTVETLREYKTTISVAHNFEVHDIYFGLWSPYDTTSRDTSFLYNWMAKDSGIPVVSCEVDSTDKVKKITFPYPSFLNLNYEKQNILCHGDSSGWISVSPAGGIGPYYYQWNTGSNDSIIENLEAGNYSVTVTDDYGLTKTKNFTITEPEAITIDATITPASDSTTTDGSIALDVSGGTSPYSYSWSNGAESAINENLNYGEYNVSITDANGCIALDTFRVGVKIDSITISFITEPVSCYGMQDGSIEAQAEGGIKPYSYSWSTGATTSSIDNLGAGTYYLTVTGDSIYQVTDSVQLTEPEPLNVTIEVIEHPDENQENGKLNALVQGGTEPYNYLWSTGETQQAISELSQGKYWVEVTDSNSCSSSDTIQLSTLDIASSGGKNIQVFPTLVQNKLIVKFADNQVYNGYIVVYSSTGKFVRKTKLDQLRTTIKLEDLKPGVYFYNILVNKKAVKQGKFVIHR
jgi:hypothetical protein